MSETGNKADRVTPGMLIVSAIVLAAFSVYFDQKQLFPLKGNPDFEFQIFGEIAGWILCVAAFSCIQLFPRTERGDSDRWSRRKLLLRGARCGLWAIAIMAFRWRGSFNGHLFRPIDCVLSVVGLTAFFVLIDFLADVFLPRRKP